MAGLVNAGKNLGINGVTAVATHISLHVGHPSTTGANEVTGGTYARQACSFDAAASGATQNTAAESFTLLPAVAEPNPITHVGLWSALSGGTFYGSAALGGAADVFTALNAGDVFRAPAHGLSDTNRVELEAPSGGTLPTGVVVNTIYFIVSATTDTFQVSATSGGAAVVLTSDGSGAVRLISAKIANSGDTFTIALGDLDFTL